MSRSSESKSRIFLEQLADTVDVLRAWVTQSWKIGTVMLKGAYLLSERKRLFTKLGEEVYYKIERGELQNKDLESLVTQLGRLTKKVELEELAVRTARFGRNPIRKNSDTDLTENGSPTSLEK